MQSTGRSSRLPSAGHLMSAAAILLVAACGSSGGTVQESQGGGGATATAKASASVAAGGDTSSPGTLLTACDLVTAADVKAATGRRPRPASSSPPAQHLVPEHDRMHLPGRLRADGRCG